MNDLVMDDHRYAAFEVGAAVARRLFDTLAKRTADPPGITRIAYGDGERIALLH